MNKLTSIELINEGNKLCEKDPLKAQKLISMGIKINPEESTSYYNLGVALHMQKKPESAIKAYQISLNIEGGPIKSARKNLTQDLLLTGNYKEGWKEYEKQLNSNENHFLKNHLGEKWPGLVRVNDLPKNIILIAEQGFGDTIQFFRFAILMEKLGVNVIVFCQREIISLLKEGNRINKITHSLSETDLDINTKWCPLLSMPSKFNINSLDIPFHKAYIKADKEKSVKWEKLLIREPNHKLIGLSWQGNPKFERTIYTKGRSMPFNYLLTLQGIDNIEFISLQKGEGQKQLHKNDELKLVKGHQYFDGSYDFTDTAAVIAQCDLVITTDNVIAHLAGAMGIRTWVALQWIPEWRWGLQSDLTKWYPTIKLFRQTSQNNWNSVMTKIKNELIQQFN